MILRSTFIAGIAAGIALSGAFLFIKDTVSGPIGTGASHGANADTYVAQRANEVPDELAQGPGRLAQVSGVSKSKPIAAVSPQAVVSMTPKPVVGVPKSASPSVTPAPTAKPKVSVPTPTPTPSPTPAPTPTPSATPSPTPASTPDPTPESIPSDSGLTLVISEIAWAGTAASQYGEWLELYNGGSEVLDMADYALVELESTGEHAFLYLSGTLSAGGFYLIERVTESSPDPIGDVSADVMASFGQFGLPNTGTYIVVVRLSDGEVLDGVDCSGGWFAGDSAGRASMERIDLAAPGTPGNWGTNDGSAVVGTDAAGGAIAGTPRSTNSVSVN